MVFVIPWAILALDVGIPAGMTGAHEGVASFFGESGFLFTGAGSGCDTPPRWREGTLVEGAHAGEYEGSIDTHSMRSTSRRLIETSVACARGVG